jgi:hypothetical protein
MTDDNADAGTVYERLKQTPIPRDVPAQRWREFREDVERFEADWGESAWADGWTLPELYGLDRARPLVRLDHTGAIWFCHGDPVIEVTEKMIRIRRKDGATHSVRRWAGEWRGSVVPWEMT